MKDFERNFWKVSAVCPKCGSGNPEPAYVWPEIRGGIAITYTVKVVCKCRCGFEWEEK